MTNIRSEQSEQKRRAEVQISAPPAQGLYDPKFEHDACGLGFVVHMKGKKSHQLVTDALKILVNLDHRGACGCEANTGDGAGILIQMPHEFLAIHADKLGIKLPPLGQYGLGMIFLPKNKAERDNIKREFERVIADEGQTVLGWRDVPTDNSSLGETAVAAEPFMAQVFVGRNPNIKDEQAFEKSRNKKSGTAKKLPAAGFFTSPACRRAPAFTRAC
jgi:glutamate synthase (ferredoxin)